MTHEDALTLTRAIYAMGASICLCGFGVALMLMFRDGGVRRVIDNLERIADHFVRGEAGDARAVNMMEELAKLYRRVIDSNEARWAETKAHMAQCERRYQERVCAEQGKAQVN